MKLETFSELYALIAKGTQNVPSRQQAIKLRKAAFASFASDEGFTKVAFDTRRIDQSTQVNPRRGLQNYQRSEEFITQAVGMRITNLAKVKRALNNLKAKYGHEHEWQDSNARILLSTIEKGLRTDYQDGDFTESQPGVGSLDYIDELLHVRYRLSFDDICRKSEAELERVILSKDEELTRQGVHRDLEITKRDVGTKNYESLLEKLFEGCKASADNPDVERTITITVRDKFHKEG
jgi:hypothetical protein